MAAREITKKFEEFRRGTLLELQTYFAQQEPRGEFVLLVAGNDGSRQAAPDALAGLGPVELVERLQAAGQDRKAAMREAAQRLGISHRDVYQACLAAEK